MAYITSSGKTAIRRADSNPTRLSVVNSIDTQYAIKTHNSDQMNDHSTEQLQSILANADDTQSVIVQSLEESSAIQELP